MRKRIALNAVAAVLQVLVSTATLVLLYRFLVDMVGVERVGVWSVVLAAASASRIADLGLGNGVTRFVAMHLSRGESDRACEILQTVAITLAVFFAVVLAVAYPFLVTWVRLVVPHQFLTEALAIIPYAMISLWLNVVASVFLSALDGTQRADLRSGLNALGAIVLLGTGIWWVPSAGLIGLAWGQIAQACVLLIGAWVLIRMLHPSLPLCPHSWRWRTLRETLVYGANFQIAALFMTLSDPVTKSLIGAYGNMSFAGLYEMVNRLVMQVRSIIVAGNQVLVPVFSKLAEQDRASVDILYVRSLEITLFVAFPMFGALAVGAPLISKVWLGQYDHTFVWLTFVMVGAWLVNAVSVPAYLSNLGTGELRWNTIAHIVIGFLNALIGFWLAPVIGAWGAVAAWAVALVFGSLSIPLAYHYKRSIVLSRLLPRVSWLLPTVVVTASVAILLFDRVLATAVGDTLGGSIILGAFCVVVAVAAYMHPAVRRKIGVRTVGRVG